MISDDSHKKLDHKYLSLPRDRKTSLQLGWRRTLSPSPQDDHSINKFVYTRRRAMTVSSNLIPSSSREKTVSYNPSDSSKEDITFQLRLRNAYFLSYNPSKAQALEKYLSTLDFKRLDQFFLKNLAQFSKGELHLAEWACTYLIAKNKLSVTLEHIRSYPFVLRVISRINGWRKQSLLEKYASVRDQKEAIYDPLFGYSIISFLYKISKKNEEISIFNSQVKPVKSTGISDKSGEIKNIITKKGNRFLIIYDPMRISDEKNSPFYIVKLIRKRAEQRANANANAKRKETTPDDNEFKLLYILSKGNHIAIIEMSISKSSRKIVIRNPNSLLMKPEVIKEIKAIAKENEYQISVKTDDNQLGISQLENYYYITKSISDFLIPDTLKITLSGNRDKFLFNEIAHNLNFSKPHCFFDLFKVSILWDGHDFCRSMGASKESKPLKDKDSIKIANEVSTLMLSTLYTCFFMNKKFKASKLILDVDIELLKIYHNLFYAIKPEKPIVDKPEKSPISRLFTKTNKDYELPASLLRIQYYLINNKFTTINDLQDLLFNLPKTEGESSSNGVYQSMCRYYCEIISNKNSFEETRIDGGSHCAQPRMG